MKQAKQLMNRIQGMATIGNHLHSSPSQQPESAPRSAKRPIGSSQEQPFKRLRKNSEVRIPELPTLDGSSDIVEIESFGNSSQRKMGFHDGQSHRSSGDGRTKAPNVEELRNTAKYAKSGSTNGRARHKKNDRPRALGPSGQTGDSTTSRATAPGPPYKRRLLGSQQPEETIEDWNEGDTAKRSGGAQSKSTITRKPQRFETRRFQPDLSDDELNADVSPLRSNKMRGETTTPAESGIMQSNPTNSKYKRSAGGSPDVLHDGNPAKRPAGSSNQADNKRTKLLTGRNLPDSVRVGRAVCLPGFVYPAAEGIPDQAPGATNKLCHLIPPTESKSDAWEAVDEQGIIIPELWWITPKLSKVTAIVSQQGSHIVRLNKSSDFSTSIPTGASLWIEFETTAETHSYVERCGNVGKAIKQIDSLISPKEIEKTIVKVKQHHQSALPPDMQLAQAQAARAVSKRPSSAGSVPPAALLHERQTDQKSLRDQMRIDDRAQNVAVSEVARHGRTPNAAEETELRKMFSGDCSDDGRKMGPRRSRRRASPSPQQEAEFATSPAKSTRSVKAKARQSTPPSPERWTDKNPNWVEQHKFRTPLIYERTTINAADIERLDEGQYLNDEIISFYAKHLHKGLETRDERIAKKVYVFSSFFWEKLRSKGHSGVKSWTTRIDLSTFDYIVVPINQSAHWYVAIICNPGRLLPGDADRQDKIIHPAAYQKDEPTASLDSEASPNVSPVTAGVSQISIESPEDGPESVDLEKIPVAAISSTKKASTSKKGPGRKYDPDDARVIVFDSLGGTHSDVARILKNYLKEEFKDKKHVDFEPPWHFGMAAKDIPRQDNFTDCGVYLLGYLEEFMKDPYEFTRRILQNERRTWDVNASDLRTKIRDLIFDEQSKYQKVSNDERREKRARRQNSSHTPPTGSLPPSSRVASEQPPQRSSAANSPVSSFRLQTPAAAPLRGASPLRQSKDLASSDKRTPTISPPSLQRRRISPTQEITKSSPTANSRQRPDDEIQTGDVKISTTEIPSESVDGRQATPADYRHPSSTAISRNPIRVMQSSSSSVQETGSLGANSSMVVNHSQSFESITEQNGQDAGTPPPQELVQSVESGGTVHQDPPSPAKSPTPLSAFSDRVPPATYDGVCEERKFLAPMASSSPSSSRPTSVSATPRPASKGLHGRSRATSPSSKRDTIRSRHGPEPEKQLSSKHGGLGYKAIRSPSAVRSSSAVPSSPFESKNTARHRGQAAKEDLRQSKKNQREGETRRPKSKGKGESKRSANSTIDLTAD